MRFHGSFLPRTARKLVALIVIFSCALTEAQPGRAEQHPQRLIDLNAQAPLVFISADNPGDGEVLIFDAKTGRRRDTIQVGKGPYGAQLALLECQCALGGASTVYFYQSGETTPCNVLTNTPSIEGGGATFDRQGTLWFQTFATGRNTEVSSASGECSAKDLLLYTFQNDIAPDVGLYFSKSNNFIVQSFGNDDSRGKSDIPLFTYKLPAHGEFNNPLSVTHLDQYGKTFPEQTRALSADGRYVWASHYPEGGASIETLAAPLQAAGETWEAPRIDARSRAPVDAGEKKKSHTMYDFSVDFTGGPSWSRTRDLMLIKHAL